MKAIASPPRKIDWFSNDVDSTLLLATSIEDNFFKIASKEMTCPVLMILTRIEGEVYQSTMTIEGAESSDELKEAFGLLWRHMITQPETVSVIQFSEAWLVELEKDEANDTAPSQHPRRVEAFIILAEFPNGRIINRNTPFKRSKKKSIPERLKTPIIMDSAENDSRIQGRLLGDL